MWDWLKISMTLPCFSTPLPLILPAFPHQCCFWQHLPMNFLGTYLHHSVCYLRTCPETMGSWLKTKKWSLGSMLLAFEDSACQTKPNFLLSSTNHSLSLTCLDLPFVTHSSEIWLVGPLSPYDYRVQCLWFEPSHHQPTSSADVLSHKIINIVLSSHCVLGTVPGTISTEVAKK